MLGYPGGRESLVVVGLGLHGVALLALAALGFGCFSAASGLEAGYRRL